MSNSSNLVLITGATGHIGFRTLVFLLQAGYRARVTIRKSEQELKIRKQASIQPYNDAISFIQVRDITAPDAYVEAVKGVDMVIHLASPIASNFKEGKLNDFFINPAVKGTMSMLEAAAKEPNVKRVVITSSIAVLQAPAGSDRAGPYDVRSSRNQAAIDAITNVFEAYTESKVQAHNAATEFRTTRNPAFDVVKVLPGYTRGANELCDAQDELMSGANRTMLEVATGGQIDGPKLTAQVFLDDVAKAHVLALKDDVAKDGDNLVIAGTSGTGIPWDEVAKTIREVFPREVEAGILKPGEGTQDWMTKFDVTSSERALEFKFAGIDVMVRSLVGQYLTLAGH